MPPQRKTAAERTELQRQIEQVRAMSDEEKLLAGARLFDMACRITIDGIRHEAPGTSEAEALRIISERLRIARRMEDRNQGRPP